MTNQSTTFQPTRAYERIQLMDALRGFALLGILAVNIASFSRYEWEPAHQRSQEWLTDLLHILVDTKFMTLFAILFGTGFAMQQQRALATGTPFRTYYLRRMLLLFGLGCLHAYGLWFGDIIRAYALCGIALLAVSHLSTQVVFRLAVLFIGFITPLTFLLHSLLGIHTNPTYVNGLPLATYLYTTFTNGSYPQILQANWLIDPWHNFAQDMPISLVSMFGRMLLGVWLARIQFFGNPVAHTGRLKRWLVGGVPGVGSSVVFWAINKGLLDTDTLLMIPVIFAVSVGLVMHSLFYLALFTKLYTGVAGGYLLRFLAPVGRMGLTNYFGQTLLAFAFFYSTGWVGHTTPIQMLGVTIAIFAVQILLSRWWLSHHAFGPVEWLWRQLSYSPEKSKTRQEAPTGL